MLMALDSVVKKTCRWCLCLAVLLVLGACSDDPDVAPSTSSTNVSTTTTQPSPLATTSTAIAPTTTLFVSDVWDVVPDHRVVGRTFPVVVWTGAEVVVWGGERPSESAWHADGAAFDPIAGTWRDLAASPLAARSEHVGVWTGSEIVICCGRMVGQGLRAAAYDPTTDQWREIAAPPIGPVFAEGVWTGEEVIIFGGVGRGGVGELRGAAAYDPDSDTWRELADLPYGIERTADSVMGDGVIYVWPSGFGGASRGPLVYDIAADEWTPLPQPPAEAPETASVVWTGTKLFAYGAGENDAGEAVGVAVMFDPKTEEWTLTEPAPLDPTDHFEGTAGSEAAVLGIDKVYLWTGFLGTNWEKPFTNVLTYDLTTDEWEVLDPAPTPQHGLYHEPIIWTGTQLITYTTPMLALTP